MNLEKYRPKPLPERKEEPKPKYSGGRRFEVSPEGEARIITEEEERKKKLDEIVKKYTKPEKK